MRLVMLGLGLLASMASASVPCSNGVGVCDPDHCLGGVAECCADGSVCPGHTCAKCECSDCGAGGHGKDYNAASQLTKCEGSANAFCQPDLCIGGTAMCCPSGKVCPGSTCDKCDCADCSMTDKNGVTTTIAHSGDAAYDDLSRLSTCTNSAATCDPDKCIDDIAECCADGTVCPGHTCGKCQCQDCTVHPRTHPLAPKPGPAGSGSSAGSCAGCMYCDHLECAQCKSCNAERILARFGNASLSSSSSSSGSALPLLKQAAVAHGSSGRAGALLLNAGAAIAVVTVLLGFVRAVRTVAARKAAESAASKAELGAGGDESSLERSLIDGGE